MLKILSVMNSEDFRGKIHAELDNAYKWTQEWLFKVNIDKCLVNYKKCPLYIDGTKQLVRV
jgi:hypothetical protein